MTNLSEMKYSLQLFFCFLFSTAAFSQKTVYIPAYLLDPATIDGSQFTMDKTRESDNFIVIWGNTVGIDPASYPDPDLAFNPEAILDTMEMLYTRFKNFGFLNDSAGTNLHQYKIPIVMYNTWGAGAQGYANGGDADGVIGAFWVHPIAMHTGQVAAHEFTHSLQAENTIDYRSMHGLGSVWDNAGIFWETHANFMRNLVYPQDVTAWGMDVYHLETWGDWKNTYENYELLMAIMETDGIEIINRLWRESLSGEYPLQAYKRLGGYNQSAFNDKLFQYARRMPTFDFTYNNVGSFFRQYRLDDLSNYMLSVQSVYNILRKIPGSENHYEMPVEQSPEEFSYNVIPLYQHPDSCSVIIKFKGHNDANAHAGWRYGFVTEHPDGTVSRYSSIYKDSAAKISFKLEPGEVKMYLVVMGAPADMITTNNSNDTWHGYPKHFRFPYELTISGGVPEGFQDPAAFRSQLKTAGHLHTNGGGWVQNTAAVDPSAYIAPAAMVLGNSVITGNVRLENTALVKDAILGNNVRVSDNGFINGGSYTGDVAIKGKSYSENNVMSGSAQITMRATVSNYHLSGNIEVGGDVVVYNDTGNCNNGLYYTLTNFYENNLLACDGRTAAYPTNLDVNNLYPVFTADQMNLNCHCALLPGCLTDMVDSTNTTDSTGTIDSTNTTVLTTFPNGVSIFPNPSSSVVTIHIERDEAIKSAQVKVFNSIGALVENNFYQGGNEFKINVSKLSSGIYFARIKLNENELLKTVRFIVGAK